MPTRRIDQHVTQPGRETSRLFEVVLLEGIEQVLDHPLGDRLRLPDQLAEPEIVIAGTPAVAVLERFGAGEQQDDQVVGPQLAETLDRRAPIGRGRLPGEDLCLSKQRVLHLGVVRRGVGGPAVVAESLFVAAGRPVQDFGPVQKQVGPIAAQFERSVDGGQRGLVVVLAKQRDGQVRMDQRLVGPQFEHSPVGRFGVDGRLVLKLGIARIA